MASVALGPGFARPDGREVGPYPGLMSRSGVRAVATVIVAVLVLDVAALAVRDDSGGSAPPVSSWSRLGEIAYVVPVELPSGWVLSVADEWVGRPRSEWTTHVEILAKSDWSRFLVLSAYLPDDPEHSGAVSGPVRDEDLRDFRYLLSNTLKVRDIGGLDPFDPRPIRGRSVTRVADRFVFSVLEVSTTPDDAFVTAVAGELARSTRLDFALPPLATNARLQPLAQSAGYPEDTTQYRASWTPRDRIGPTRRDTDRTFDGPHLSISVGCRFYAQGRRPRFDPRTAEIRRDRDRLSMAFDFEGSSVSLSGEGLDERAMRAAATSLRTYDQKAWRDELGARLVVMKQKPE